MTNNRPLTHSGVKKRVLIVNCFFDESRQPIRRTTKIPQALGPVYLAGAFNRELCEVRLYNEVDSGPLLDENLFAWPDMLVMTGLTNSFDRMLHLTAYVRTKKPKNNRGYRRPRCPCSASACEAVFLTIAASVTLKRCKT